MQDKKIFITGATGLVAGPVIQSLAAGNEVWCSSRLRDPADRARFEAMGVKTFAWDIETGDLDGLPNDFTHVLHAGTVRTDLSLDVYIEVTCRSIGKLMYHCRTAESFLYMSSAVVYDRLELGHLHREDDPLGVNTKSKWGPSYGLSKLSGEGACRALAHALGLKTTIARLNVAYGPYPPHGGLPARLFERALSGLPVLVPPEGDSCFSPIHVDDIARQVPLLWDVASVPATIVNFGGDDTISIRELFEHLGPVTGVEGRFEEDEASSALVAFDSTRRRRLIGDCHIGWKEGIASSILTRFGDRLSV